MAAYESIPYRVILEAGSIILSKGVWRDIMRISDRELNKRSSLGHIVESIVREFDGSVFVQEGVRQGECSMCDSVAVEIHESVQNLRCP
jgi:hypothetical protein